MKPLEEVTETDWDLTLDVNGNGDRIEIEVPAHFDASFGEVAVLPRRFRVYPALA